MKLLRKIRVFFVAIMLPATVLLFFNDSTNKHYHRMLDGELVEVAHPFYRHSENPNHPKESSEKEIIILSQIFYAFSGEIVIDEAQIELLSFVLPFFIEPQIDVYVAELISSSGTDPPFCFA
jgi:hypothetical protein